MATVFSMKYMNNNSNDISNNVWSSSNKELDNQDSEAFHGLCNDLAPQRTVIGYVWVLLAVDHSQPQSHCNTVGKLGNMDQRPELKRGPQDGR